MSGTLRGWKQSLVTALQVDDALLRLKALGLTSNELTEVYAAAREQSLRTGATILGELKRAEHRLTRGAPLAELLGPPYKNKEQS